MAINSKMKKINLKNILKKTFKSKKISKKKIKKTLSKVKKNKIKIKKTKKNLKHESKLILIEALWDIIYSDENADMYEENLMRRLSGLLYLDKKTVGDIKEKIKNKKL